MDAAWVWVSDAVHGGGQVKKRRVEAFKEAAHAALETALTTQDVETLRKSTQAAWRSEQDAERLRARAVSACEEEIARAQRMLAKAQGMLQRVQATQSPAELREVGLEVVSTANKDTLCAMAVQAAVQDGVDVNTRAEAAAGEEPRERWLRHVAKEGLVETVRALAAAGAEVNHANNLGYTALDAAAIHGHVEATRALLAAGAEVDRADNLGYTALDAAVHHGHVEAMQALLEAGAEVHHANNNGCTALTAAAFHGHVEAVRALGAPRSDTHGQQGTGMARAAAGDGASHRHDAG